MDLTETAAVACRSIVALGSLAIPSRLRFGPNDGIPHIIGTGFVVDTRGVVMTAGHVLRHGVVSSVHPFPCPEPHGFSIDAISHGGASGSPIFRRDDPAVLGMLYAAFEGEGVTQALPGHLLQWAARAALADGTLNLNGVPSLDEYRTRDQTLDAWYAPEPG